MQQTLNHWRCGYGLVNVGRCEISSVKLRQIEEFVLISLVTWASSLAVVQHLVLGF